MKRIPGIKPQFTRCRIVRPDGSVLDAWEMFVGERSYGRSDSKAALLRAWEARLEEAENARPFVFRPAHRLQNAAARDGTKRTDEQPARAQQPPRAVTPPAATEQRKRARGR